VVAADEETANRSGETQTMRDEIEAVYQAAGARVFLHARDLDSDAEFGIDAYEPVVLASVFKIAVLVELARQVAAGTRRWTERVRVPADRRTDGPTGLSVMLDDADLSLRDLAFWMMSVSDNTATDVVMELLGGPDPINAAMRDLGLAETVILADCKVLLDDLGAQLGLTDGAKGWNELTAETLRACPALHPAATNRSTPREITALLAMIWHDKVAPAEDCALLRRILSLQVWPHRLTSGFPDGVALSAKTGTLPGIRNEAGVVEFAGGGRYAVAVFTRADDFAYRQPAIDAAIGTAARLAIQSLA
jgi:beta-lactamase class A